jgi:hypothetical protein
MVIECAMAEILPVDEEEYPMVIECAINLGHRIKAHGAGIAFRHLSLSQVLVHSST